MSVLVFDPGGTTGWAFLSDGKIEAGSFKMWDDVWDIIWGRAHLDISTVVIESFILRRGKALALSGSRLETVQVIGYIKAVCDNYDIQYVEQQPSCKSLKITKIEGLSIHAMDAVRHGLYYLKRNKQASLYRAYLTREDREQVR